MIIDQPQPHDMYWVVASDPDGKRVRRVHLPFGVDGFRRGYKAEMNEYESGKPVPVRVLQLDRPELFDIYLLGQLRPTEVNATRCFHVPGVSDTAYQCSADYLFKTRFTEEMIPCGTVRTAFLEPGLGGGGAILNVRVRRSGVLPAQILHSFGDVLAAPFIIVGDAALDREVADSDIEYDVEGTPHRMALPTAEKLCVGYPHDFDEPHANFSFLAIDRLPTQIFAPGSPTPLNVLFADGKLWNSKDLRLLRQGKSSQLFRRTFEQWAGYTLENYKRLLQEGATVEDILEEVCGIRTLVRVPEEVRAAVRYSSVAGLS